jgi:rhodanese-related sulfurtransferase
MLHEAVDGGSVFNVQALIAAQVLFVCAAGHERLFPARYLIEIGL